MVDEQANDGMIEIGDPAEEPAAPEPDHQVVIEYRDRGVPWMLIPPLIVLSAVGAVVAYHKFAPTSPRTPAVSLSRAASTGDFAAPTDGPKPADTVAPAVAAPGLPPVRQPVDPTPDLPATPAHETSTGPEKPADPPAFPRVQGLGFDPKALEAEPTDDVAISPASKEVRPDRPAEEVAKAAPPELPKEVDPDLLPPDPRLARVRQQQRLADSLRQVEADRARFHADLKVACKKFPADWEHQVLELYKRYGTEVEPESKKQATWLLGKSGRYVGADRATRIDVLRASGYPETVILDDIFTIYERRRIGERDGPRDDYEAMYRSALYLLKHPPGRRASSRTDPIASPNPAAGPATSPLPPGAGVR